MATGDITATINPDGWSATLAIEGFTRGATYAFGYSGNNVPGANTPFFTVVSLGYDATGAATTRTRTVYLTPRGTNSVVRFPYSTVYLTGTFDAGTFTDGETVTQAVSGATGIVVGNQTSGTRLYFRNVTGTFNNTNQITGGTSGATFTSSSTITTPTMPTNNEQVNSTSLLVVVALSDYVYQKDNTGGGNSGTAPTFTAPAAFVTNTAGAGQTSNAATAAAVTQSSAAAYPKVVANWSRPPFQRVTGNFPLGVVAFHGTSVVNAGTQVAPGQHNIACIVFTVSDTSAHSTTTTVTAPTIDSTYGDQVPVLEHLGTIDVTTLTALNVLTCNFVAYPLVGDSGSIVDSSAGAAQPTPLVGPITALNDKSNTYGITVAYVTNAGSDAGTTVYPIGSYPGDATAYQFLTIARAAQQIQAYNLATYGRNDCGGGIIYLANGNYAWLGSARSLPGTKPATWCTVTKAATASRGSVKITSQANDWNICNLTRVTDITMEFGTILFYLQDHVWFDNNTINTAGTSFQYVTTSYWTRNTIPQLGQGIQSIGAATNSAPALVRGNNFDSFAGAIFHYTTLGNSKVTAAGSINFKDFVASQTWPNAVNTIFAFNRVTGTCTTAFLAIGSNTATNSIGFAVVQNIFENVDNVVADMVSLASGAATPVNNGIVWHNVFVGQRLLIAYDATGTALTARKYWSVKNNLVGDWNIKSDTFITQNGNRVGNWPALFGTAFSGNIFAENIASSGANGDFINEWAGLSSIEPAITPGTQPPSGTPNAAGYLDFVNDLSWHTGADTAGNGNYRLNTGSPAKGLQREWVLPYDFAGNRRVALGDSGAYAPLLSKRSPVWHPINSRVIVPLLLVCCLLFAGCATNASPRAWIDRVLDTALPRDFKGHADFYHKNPWFDVKVEAGGLERKDWGWSWTWLTYDRNDRFSSGRATIGTRVSP